MTTELTPETTPEFSVTVRGYDRAQVDEYIDWIREWLGNATSRMKAAEGESAQLREQLREDGRHAIETMARRYAETEGRRAIEAVIRQAGPPGGAVAEDLVRSVAREVVPTIAERLIREEIARLRREVRPG